MIFVDNIRTLSYQFYHFFRNCQLLADNFSIFIVYQYINTMNRTKKDTRLGVFSFLVAGVGFAGPVKNIVVSGTWQGSYPILLVFSLVALASPSTGRACAPSPLPPPSVVEGTNLSLSRNKRKQPPCGDCFFRLARGPKKDTRHLYVVSNQTDSKRLFLDRNN